jgi:membrane protein implicated in regulation of membrane protease activity
MQDFFVSLGTWNWVIAGGVLLALEILAPGSFMLWLGLSALLVGAIALAAKSFAFAYPWQAQFVCFAIFALASIPLFRRFARKVEGPVDQPFLNRRADAYVGRVFTLEKPIVAGHGTVKIDDTIWRIAGLDCAAGSRVKVVSTDGGTLMVEPAGA